MSPDECTTDLRPFVYAEGCCSVLPPEPPYYAMITIVAKLAIYFGTIAAAVPLGIADKPFKSREFFRTAQ